jgi:uncharacterized membrane protein
MIVTTIARGDASRIEEARRVIARTDDEWRALWATHAGPGTEAPSVDLSRVVVAAAFAGERPSAGHTIDITAVDQPGGGVRLAVEERAPDRHSVSALILTSPFHIVAVERVAGDVSWAEDRDVSREVGAAGRGEREVRASPVFPRASTSSTGLEPRIASTLAYLAGPFSGFLILLAESTNQDVRFHAWQSIVGLGGLGLALLASYILAFAALFVSASAVSVMFGVAAVIWIVLAMVWALCLWKAWSGERWKLPIAGDYAERLL